MKKFVLTLFSLLMVFCSQSQVYSQNYNAEIKAVKNGIKEMDALGVLDNLNKIPYDNTKINNWMKRNVNKMDPIYLYMLADRIFYEDKYEAVYWFTIAKLRLYYLASISEDRNLIINIQAFTLFAPKTAEYFNKNYKNSKVKASALKALDWDKSQYPYIVKTALYKEDFNKNSGIKFGWIPVSDRKQVYETLQQKFRKIWH